MLTDMLRSDAISATALVDAILARGHAITVHDGEAFAVKRSSDRNTILDALASTEADTLIVRDANGTKLGSFFLVYGNGPDELIADYTFNPFCEAMAKRACPGMF